MTSGKPMIAQRTKLINQIEDGLLIETEARQSLAGWLLKYWEENGMPIFTHNQTPQQNAYYNASCSIDTVLGK
jgi:hypothetical protein